MGIAGDTYKYDWKTLKAEYITGNISVENLCKKHNIPYSTMKDRATKDNWLKDKKKHRERIVDKTSEKVASQVAKKLAKEYAIADKLADVLKAALEDSEQFRRHIVQTRDGDTWDADERVFGKVDMKAVKDAAAALKVVEEVKRSIGGLFTAQEQERFDIERRKLAIDEAKAGTGTDNNDETGVVILAPVLPEDEDDAD